MTDSRPWLHAARAAALLSLVSLIGCEKSGTPDSMVMSGDVVLDEATIDAQGMWSSAPFQNAQWIPLGPSAEVEVEHGLGRMPTSIQVYISGIGDDRADAEPRAFSPAAGDVANILHVSADSVTLKNRTKGQFYVRLVLF